MIQSCTLPKNGSLLAYYNSKKSYSSFKPNIITNSETKECIFENLVPVKDQNFKMEGINEGEMNAYKSAIVHELEIKKISILEKIIDVVEPRPFPLNVLNEPLPQLSGRHGQEYCTYDSKYLNGGYSKKSYCILDFLIFEYCGCKFLILRSLEIREEKKKFIKEVYYSSHGYQKTYELETTWKGNRENELMFYWDKENKEWKNELVRWSLMNLHDTMPNFEEINSWEKIVKFFVNGRADLMETKKTTIGKDLAFQFGFGDIIKIEGIQHNDYVVYLGEVSVRIFKQKQEIFAEKIDSSEILRYQGVTVKFCRFGFYNWDKNDVFDRFQKVNTKDLLDLKGYKAKNVTAEQIAFFISTGEVSRDNFSTWIKILRKMRKWAFKTYV